MQSPDFNKIFFPYHDRQHRRIKDDGVRFAHYTCADTAFKMIKNQEIWLRNVALMSDYNEFEHGKHFLIKLFEESLEGQEMRQVFNEIAAGTFDSTYTNFKSWAPIIKNDFYVSSFSEHENKEDDIGKLSMWRAYGANTGVAIVFKQEFFNTISNYGLDFSSVAYLEPAKIKQEIAHLTESITNNISAIKTLPNASLKLFIFNILRFAALCNKHIGFAEEKEWRLTATASIHSHLIHHEIETINGTPQQILKIRVADSHPYNLQFKDMIDKIIIGPCQYPSAIFNSIASALSGIGCDNPKKIMHISDIPLRITS